MEKYTLYLGLNDKDTKKQEIPTSEAFTYVSEHVARDFGGGTIFEAAGVYRHDNGDTVEEKTLRIELFDTTLARVRALAQTLKSYFNQESIALNVEKIDAMLI